jgi:uncharacterized membrane protein
MKEQPVIDQKNVQDRMNGLFSVPAGNLRLLLKNIITTIGQDTYLKILILLTITGLILRLWHIGDVSFWFDEVLTNRYSHYSFSEIWYTGTDGVNPPTFYLIEHCMLYFGSGEAVLRLVPALAGTCSISVLYYLGREFHNRTTGLVAAALLTVSTFHIYYSQEARPYTLFLFCFLLALFFYLRAGKTNSCRTWVLFGVFSALSCWMHLFGFVFIVPLFLFAFLEKFFLVKTGTDDSKPVILAGAIWLLLSLPMLLVSVQAGFLKADVAGSWGYQGIALIIITIQEAFGRYDSGSIILCFLFLVGIVRLLCNDRKKFLFMAGALAIPLSITIVLSYKMAIVPRYLIGLLPVLFLGISYAIGSVHRRIFTVRFSCIAILVLVAISIPSLNMYHSADSKYGHDWKGLSPELYNLTGNDDRIFIYPPYNTQALMYYYNNGTDQTFIEGIGNKKDLESVARQNPGQKNFVIIVDSGHLRRSGEIGQWLNSHSLLVEKHDDLYVYMIN